MKTFSEWWSSDARYMRFKDDVALNDREFSEVTWTAAMTEAQSEIAALKEELAKERAFVDDIASHHIEDYRSGEYTQVDDAYTVGSDDCTQDFAARARTRQSERKDFA